MTNIYFTYGLQNIQQACLAYHRTPYANIQYQMFQDSSQNKRSINMSQHNKNKSWKRMKVSSYKCDKHYISQKYKCNETATQLK